jgi:hypothetical protein
MSILPQLEHDLKNAAERRANHEHHGLAGAQSPLQPRGRGRRLWLAVPAVGLGLLTATIALAASGLLSGSAVKPSGRLTPTVGEGVPAAGGSRLLALRVADPEGGLPWGIRIVHTTRGEVCAQVGRVLEGRLGELGIDGVFNNDGRFHPIPPDVLPTKGPSSANVYCALAGQTFTGSFAGFDRSAAETQDRASAAAGELRAISFGVLGPHALSVTYRARGRSRTDALTQEGAYLIVERAGHRSAAGTFSSEHGIASTLRPSPMGSVTAITYRFDGLVCSDGTGAKVARRCPTAAPAPASTITPTRSLHQQLHLNLRIRRGAIDGAELEFTAPYAVSSAHQLYEVIQPAPPGCGSGGSGFPLERDIKQGQRIRIELLTPFPFTKQCGRTQEIQVRYVNPEGPFARSPHESVIIGATRITEPPGTHLAHEH